MSDNSNNITVQELAKSLFPEYVGSFDSNIPDSEDENLMYGVPSSLLSSTKNLLILEYIEKHAEQYKEIMSLYDESAQDHFWEDRQEIILRLQTLLINFLDSLRKYRSANILIDDRCINDAYHIILYDFRILVVSVGLLLGEGHQDSAISTIMNVYCSHRGLISTKYDIGSVEIHDCICIAAYNPISKEMGCFHMGADEACEDVFKFLCAVAGQEQEIEIRLFGARNIYDRDSNIRLLDINKALIKIQSHPYNVKYKILSMDIGNGDMQPTNFCIRKADFSVYYSVPFLGFEHAFIYHMLDMRTVNRIIEIEYKISLPPNILLLSAQCSNIFEKSMNVQFDAMNDDDIEESKHAVFQLYNTVCYKRFYYKELEKLTSICKHTEHYDEVCQILSDSILLLSPVENLNRPFEDILHKIANASTVESAKQYIQELRDFEILQSPEIQELYKTDVPLGSLNNTEIEEKETVILQH